VLDPWPRQERFGGTPLGHLLHLKAKAGGDKSRSAKQETSEGADGAVLQGPRERAKAVGLAPQSPGVEPAHASPQRLRAVRPGAARSTFADRTRGLTADRSRTDARGGRRRRRRARHVPPRRNVGSPPGREPSGAGVPVGGGGVTTAQGARSHRAQGEGGQVISRPTRGGTREANRRHRRGRYPRTRQQKAARGAPLATTVEPGPLPAGLGMPLPA
jgi:hypothetical protein